MLHSYRHVIYVIRKTYFSNMFRIFKAMVRLLLHNVKFDIGMILFSFCMNKLMTLWQIRTFVVPWPDWLVQQNLARVLMSGAFYNVSTGDPPSLPPLSLLWASAVVEAHIGILFAGSWAAARSGRPAWKKCWCVLESGLPPAATTTFKINHTFHLSANHDRQN